MNKFLAFVCVLGLLFSTAYTAGNKKLINFNPEENIIDKLAYDALLENVAQMDTDMKLVEIISCETQVVSGQNYFLTLAVEVFGQVQEYSAQIYVVPWEQNATVMKFEKVQKMRLEQSQEQQMDGGVQSFNWYGAESDSVFSQQKKQITKLIVSELQNRQLETNFKVVAAKTQVVSGINYILTIMVGVQEYEVTIFSQVWNNVLEITSFYQMERLYERQPTLKNLRKQYRQSVAGFEKSPVVELDESVQPIPQKQVGAFQAINFDEEEQSLKNLVLRGISQRLQTSQHKIQVTSASRRVVNGLLYEIEFTFDGIEYTADVQIIPYEQVVKVLHLVKV